MRATILMLAVAWLGGAGALTAQEPHVVDDAALGEALEARADTERAERDRVRALLEREEVREVAGRFGFDLTRIDAAVATLSGEELTRVARRARAVEDSLIGAQDAVTISTTTIIIGLLVLIVLILIL